ncbi:hypothetical protein EMPG_10376 [Blastomyces silverae]|uniref:Uncharacterized protein n=1 Tax=Blastomyces silverae TaxID=2060906 RepID=A0A0H1B470_9EURO|nr:hypothetical protein EMPG_10376 [Blastomyces silverae]
MEPSPLVTSRRKRLKARAKDWIRERKAKERKKRVNSDLGTGVHHVRKSAAKDGGIPQQRVVIVDSFDASSDGHSSSSPPKSDDSQIVSTGSVQALPEQSNTLPATLPHQVHWPENLWDEAYANLLDQKKDLIVDYQNYLLKKEDQSQVDDLRDAAGQEQLQELLRHKLDRIKETRLNIPVYAKKINGEIVVERVVVRDQVCKIIGGLQSVSGFVNVAMSSMPPAALAWAGVLVILPVVMNAITQDDEAMNGLEFISELLVRCKVREDILRRRFREPVQGFQSQSESKNLGELRSAIKAKTVQLYSDILQYQIQLAIHYDRGCFRRSLGDIVISNDWKSMTTDLENASDNIHQDLSEDDRNTIANGFDNLKESAERSLSSLKKIEQDIEGISQDSLLKELPRAIFAAFDSSEAPGETTSLHRTCLQGTRIDTLNLVQRWSNALHDYKGIFWLKGMPGTGKSTIARTVAGKLASEGRLAGSFFFSKRRANLTNAAQLFTTLSSQLTEILPGLRPHVCAAIEKRRDIAGKSLSEQWVHLIFRPLVSLDETLHEGLYPPFVLVFVIDALDECEGDDDLKEILPLFSQLRDLRIIKLRVFMTSRPEKLLRSRFSRMPDAYHHDEDLHKIKPSDIQDDKDDITKLFEHELALMREEIPLQDNWPGKERVKKLILKADGLFIYAATACRFLAAAASEKLADLRLDTILSDDGDKNSPQRNIDSIYTQILKFSVANKIEKEKTEIYGLFRRVLGPVILLFNPLSTDALSKLLSVPKEQINDVLRDLHSLLLVPNSEEEPIQTLHLSFPEFLSDPERCPTEFLIDRNITHAKLTERCLESMSNILTKDICGLKLPGTLAKEVEQATVAKYIPNHVQYACRYWINHLLATDLTPFMDETIYRFLRDHILHWFEALSLLGKIGEGANMIVEFSERLSSIQQKPEPLYIIVHDAKRFMLYFMSMLEKAPLQVYISGLLFSPKKSIIRDIHINCIPAWIRMRHTPADDWSALLYSIRSEYEPNHVVKFSMEGRYLVSTDRHGNLNLYDFKTGVLRGILETYTRSSHPQHVSTSPDGRFAFCYLGPRFQSGFSIWNIDTRDRYGIDLEKGLQVVASEFSPNSELLATALDNRTIRLWDPKTGAFQATLTGCLDDRQPRLSISLNGKHLASSSRNKVQIWDLRTGNLSRTFKSRSYNVIIEFSPVNQVLAFLSKDTTIRLWDPETDKSFALEGHEEGIWAINFAPNGQLLASGDRSGVIRLWDVSTGTCLANLGRSHPRDILDIHFSPDGQFFASASADGTIKVWDLASKTLRNYFMRNDITYGVRFSPDSKYLASVSDSQTILWDLEIKFAGNSLDAHRKKLTRLKFSPDGKFLAHTSSRRTYDDSYDDSYDETLVMIWETKTGALYKSYRFSHGIVFVSFSADSRMLAILNGKSIKLCYLDAETPDRELSGFEKVFDIRSLVISPTGRFVALLTTNNDASPSDPTLFVSLWEPGRNKCTRISLDGLLSGRDDPTLAFSADEQVLAAVTEEEACLWDLDSNQLVKKIHDLPPDTNARSVDVINLTYDEDGTDITYAFPGKGRHSGFDISRYFRDWIAWKGNRLLWVPPGYYENSTHHSAFAIADEFGRVMLFYFDIDTLRQAMGKLLQNT